MSHELNSTEQCPIMNEEVRKQLMGLLPYSDSAREHYIPKDFVDKKIPEEFKPVFELKPWTQAEKDDMMILIQQMDTIDKKEAHIINKKLNEGTRKAITGWKNFYDIGSGELIEYQEDKKGGADKKVWDRVPDTIKTSLYFKVGGMSGILAPEIVSLKS
jgi:hypothetical protein